jgi:hypothetical protein
MARFPNGEGTMKKPNVFFAGDPRGEDLVMLKNRTNIIMIECADAKQAREILMTGRVECTVFGEEE